MNSYTITFTFTFTFTVTDPRSIRICLPRPMINILHASCNIKVSFLCHKRRQSATSHKVDDEKDRSGVIGYGCCSPGLSCRPAESTSPWSDDVSTNYDSRQVRPQLGQAGERTPSWSDRNTSQMSARQTFGGARPGPRRSLSTPRQGASPRRRSMLLSR